MSEVKRWNAPKGATIQEADNGEFVLASDFEGEIAKRDARIGELENDASYYAAKNEELRVELADLKAQNTKLRDRISDRNIKLCNANNELAAIKAQAKEMFEYVLASMSGKEVNDANA